MIFKLRLSYNIIWVKFDKFGGDNFVKFGGGLNLSFGGAKAPKAPPLGLATALDGLPDSLDISKIPWTFTVQGILEMSRESGSTLCSNTQIFRLHPIQDDP